MAKWKVKMNYHPIEGKGELYFDDFYLLTIQLPIKEAEAIREKILENVLDEKNITKRRDE